MKKKSIIIIVCTIVVAGAVGFGIWWQSTAKERLYKKEAEEAYAEYLKVKEQTARRIELINNGDKLAYEMELRCDSAKTDEERAKIFEEYIKRHMRSKPKWTAS
jgi:flagellar basal body-associated protein FliL